MCSLIFGQIVVPTLTNSTAQLTLFPDVFQDRDYSQTFQHIHTYLLHWENHFFTSKFVCLATKLHIQPFIS